MPHKGQLTRFAAIGWHEPDLRFPFAALSLLFVRVPLQIPFAVRDECQPAPIGRPCRAVRIGVTACETHGLATFGRHNPYSGAVGIGALLNTGDNKSHALTTR